MEDNSIVDPRPPRTRSSTACSITSWNQWTYLKVLDRNHGEAERLRAIVVGERRQSWEVQSCPQLTVGACAGLIFEELKGNRAGGR